MSNIWTTQSCEECGEDFGLRESESHWRIRCPDCQKQWNSKRTHVPCRRCRAEILRHPDQDYRGQFCPKCKFDATSREALRIHLGSTEKIYIHGTYSKDGSYGRPNGWSTKNQDTILLLDVRWPDDEWICDHLWISATEWVKSKGGEEGDRLEVAGLVEEYEREDGSKGLGLKRVSSGKVLQSGNSYDFEDEFE